MRPRASHQRHHVGLIDGQVGDPGEALCLAVGPGLPVFEEVHLQLEVRVVERGGVEVAEPVMHALGIGVLDVLHRAGVHPLGRRHPLEQRLVVARLRPEDEAHVERFQQVDVRSVRGQPILDHDELQMRVLAAHILKHALRRGALAVVLRRTIALHDGLRRQGEDFALLGMHHHRAQHLVVIRDVTVLVVLLAAVFAMHARRGEVPRPVDREEVVPVQPGEPLQTLAALQRREYPFERHAQLPRVHLVEPLAQRRVARRALNPVQSLQIRPHHLVGACIAVELKQRRILQPEHRQPRHQTIAQAEPARGHRVLELVEGLAHPAQQPRCAQCLPQPPLGHVDSPIAGEIMAIMLNSRSNVYENIFSSASQPPDSSTLLQPAGIAAKCALGKARRECTEAIERFDAFEAALGTVRGALECVDVVSGALHRPEQVEALIAQAAGRIESLATGECAKLAKYLRNRAPGLVLAQNSVLPRLEALGEQWSMLAVSLGCLCWSLVRALGKRALSRHLLGAYGALQDRLGPESVALLDAVEAVLIERHRASSAIEGFNAALRPYLYVHKGVSQGFLDLFRAYFNLRTRRWGRHKRTSAHECLSGQRVGDWLTRLGYPPSPALA